MFNISSKLKLYGDNIIDEDMLGKKKHYLLFKPRMCSCNNNIENDVLRNTLNRIHMSLWLNKIIRFWWTIMYHDRLVQLHSSKWMLWDIIISMIMVVVVVVVEATDMATGKDELIFTTIMVTIVTSLIPG